MKYSVLALAAVLAVTMCVTQEPAAPAPDIGSTAPEEQTPPATMTPTYCGLTVNLLSPSPNERVSGGFRVEWELAKEGNLEFTNKEVNFTIYWSPVGGETADLKKISRFYGQTYKEDITFLSPVAKGVYTVGVRGKVQDGCTLHEGEVNITVA